MSQLARRKWSWLRHIWRRSDDSIVKHALQWAAHGHRGRGRPKNTWRTEIEKEMWTTSFEYSWKKWRRKHETELDGQEWSVAYVPLGGDKV